LLNRTLAILRVAEFGFFGVLVETRVRTPSFWGHRSAALTENSMMKIVFINLNLTGVMPHE
jgi:hypothetical protein